MLLVKSTIPKKIKGLQRFDFWGWTRRTALIICFTNVFFGAFSQDNSPYSRYGIGDLVPPTHILSRSMGGLSAAFSDYLTINFNNPASYAYFQSVREVKTKKQVLGRAILDVGMNFENRTLRDPSIPEKFVAKNAIFSYLQVGMSLRKNLGLVFGLRPISRISYKIVRNEFLTDPNTGLPIDSATTNFEGTGGAYLPTIGTGFSLIDKDTKNGKQKLSIGINAGYLFGSKDYSARRSILNDSVLFYQANYETKTTYGNIYYNAGLQYRFPIKKDVSLTLGAYGNSKLKLNATKDELRETYVYDEVQGNLRLDSVADHRDVDGKIMLPAMFTFGFIVEKEAIVRDGVRKGGWLFGLDISKQNWDQYRFYDLKDSVKNTWEVRIGTQLHPAPKKNYFSNVAYRAGFFIGDDYVRVQNKMSHYGVSFGLGLPLANYRSAYASANQVTLINLAFEYGKRGNNSNLLKENMFRISVGFSLSDFWFSKRKYE